MFSSKFNPDHTKEYQHTWNIVDEKVKSPNGSKRTIEKYLTRDQEEEDMHMKVKCQKGKPCSKKERVAEYNLKCS